MAEETTPIYGMITVVDRIGRIQLHTNSFMAITDVLPEEESREKMIETGLGRRLLSHEEAIKVREQLDRRCYIPLSELAA